MNHHFTYVQFGLTRIVVVFSVLFSAQTASHAQIQTGSFEFEGLTRNYMVFLPNNYTGTIDFPLVIYLHQADWTAQQGLDYTQLHQVADTSDFIVVYPSAIDRRWNAGGVPAPNVNDVGFLDALIDTLGSHYRIDLERIYACGTSQGGFMSYTLACQLSHRIAAIASVAGVLSNETSLICSPSRTIPVLHIHGTADVYCPINGTTAWLSVDHTLLQWTLFNNCVQVDTTLLPDLDPTDSCTVEKISHTNCSDNSNVIYYKVINGGHTWPGAGDPGYPAGPTNQDISASVEILSFFSDYQLPTFIESHEKDGISSDYVLYNNYPNPFNPTTTIRFALPKASHVKLEIYTTLGEPIATLVNETRQLGYYSEQFDATGLASGLYFYRLQAGDFVDTKKLLLLK